MFWEKKFYFKMDQLVLEIKIAFVSIFHIDVSSCCGFVVNASVIVIEPQLLRFNFLFLHAANLYNIVIQPSLPFAPAPPFTRVFCLWGGGYCWFKGIQNTNLEKIFKLFIQFLSRIFSLKCNIIYFPFTLVNILSKTKRRNLGTYSWSPPALGSS